MKCRIAGGLLLVIFAGFGGSAVAADAPLARFTPREYRVNYWLSSTKHMILQAKVNGHGPYNFVFDTGAPHMFIVATAARAANVTVVKGQEGRINKLEIIGGPSFYNFMVGIDDPNQFQLRTINSALPADKKVVGFIGCTMVSRYRIDIDYLRPFMVWTEMQPRIPKADDPPEVRAALAAEDAKAARAGGGNGASPGYLGIELDTKTVPFKITAVHKGSPAGAAGVKAGDALIAIGSAEVRSQLDLSAASAQVIEGSQVTLKIQRGQETLSVNVKAGSGF